MKIGSIITKNGKRKHYKDYDLAVAGYTQRKGYAKMIHKRTGNVRYFKL